MENTKKDYGHRAILVRDKAGRITTVSVPPTVYCEFVALANGNHDRVRALARDIAKVTEKKTAATFSAQVRAAMAPILRGHYLGSPWPTVKA